MVAKKATKRAASPKAPAAKKVKKVDPVKEKVAAVVAAIEDGEYEVPGAWSVREMLSGAAPKVLGTLQDERHAYQETIFGMLAEVFQAEQSRREAVVAEVKVRMASVDVEPATKQAAKDHAEANVQAKKDEIQGKNEVLAGDASLVREEETKLREANDEKIAAAAENQIHLDDKEKAEKVQNEHVAVLKEGSWDNNKAQRAHLTVLTPFFKKLKVDASMVTAMQSALGKKPDDRGAFDNMVVAQIDESLAKHFASLAEQLASTEATVAGRTATADAAEQTRAACLEKQQASAAAVSAAQAEKKELDGVLKEATKAVNDFAKSVSKLDAELAKVEAHCQEASEVNSTCTFLRERVIIPEPEPVEEVPEPVAEAAADQAMA